jgi:hypothetical protein
MHAAGFETAIPASELTQTEVLDRAANGDQHIVCATRSYSKLETYKQKKTAIIYRILR